MRLPKVKFTKEVVMMCVVAWTIGFQLGILIQAI